MLYKWMSRNKYFKHQNFPTHFCLSTSLQRYTKIWWKWVKSKYLINSLKVDVFLPKSNARFWLTMVCKLASGPTPGDKSIGQQNLLASMTMDQDFPQKVTHGRHFFFLHHSVECWGGWHNNGQSCQRQRKNQG